MCVQSFSHVWLFATTWTVTHQFPLSMESPGKNTRVGWQFLLERIFPVQGLNRCLSVSSALAGGVFTTMPPGKPSLPQNWIQNSKFMLSPKFFSHSTLSDYIHSLHTHSSVLYRVFKNALKESLKGCCIFIWNWSTIIFKKQNPFWGYFQTRVVFQEGDSQYNEMEYFSCIFRICVQQW